MIYHLWLAGPIQELSKHNWQVAMRQLQHGHSMLSILTTHYFTCLKNTVANYPFESGSNVSAPYPHKALALTCPFHSAGLYKYCTCSAVLSHKLIYFPFIHAWRPLCVDNKFLIQRSAVFLQPLLSSIITFIFKLLPLVVQLQRINPTWFYSCLCNCFSRFAAFGFHSLFSCSLPILHS